MTFYFNKKFLKKKRQMNKKNSTPLHWAVENNSKEIVELLLSKGVNINDVTHNDQNIEI